MKPIYFVYAYSDSGNDYEDTLLASGRSTDIVRLMGFINRKAPELNKMLVVMWDDDGQYRQTISCE